MNTKNVPALVMLSAGFIDSVLAIYYHLDSYSFLKQLLIVLLVFYIIGEIIKVILDKAFNVASAEGEDETSGEDSDGEESEDTESETNEEETK